MDRRDNFWTRRPISRRSAVRTFALSGAGVAASLAVGCGDDDDDDGGTNNDGGNPGQIPTATLAAGVTPTVPSVRRGGTFTVPWETEPTGGFDPHMMKPGFAYTMVVAVFNGLMRQAPDDLAKLIPELALSWESPDPTTYTFKLRPDVAFHDGTAFDADIVKYNAERILSPGFVMEGKYTGAAAGITKVEALDPLTVQFTFEKPKVNAIEAFYWAGQGLSGMVSRQASESAGKDFWKTPVGTGPFAFESWDIGTKITLKRNEKYFETINDEQVPFVDKLEYIALPDPAVRAINLKSGQLSATSLPSKDAKDLESDEYLVMTGGGDAIGFYPNHQTGVFKDDRLRRAVAYAIDRDALCKTIFSGLAQPTVGIPKESKWFDESFEGFTYDPKRAKEEMAAAGMPDGFSFEAMVLPTGDRPKAVEFMQAQLAEVGIKVNIAPTESSAYVDRLMVRGEGDTFFASTGLLGLTESGGFEASAMPNPGRKQNPNDPKMTEYITKIASTFDEEERRAIIQEAQRYYWNDLVAIIPVVTAYPPQVVRAEWTGISFIPPISYFPDYRGVATKA